MRPSRFLLVVFLAVLAALGGWLLFPRNPASSNPADQALGTRLPAPSKPLYWYDPMKPEVHFDKPGKSPYMDMELVPKYVNDGSGANSDSISVDPAVAQTLGMRTAPVTRGGAMTGSLRAVGAVEVDERRIYAIEARAAGWVERLDVRAVGDPVRHGQTVAGVYSPDLYAAQQELALAVKSDDAALLPASKQRLALLGVPASQIATILHGAVPQRQVAIIAPADGVVTELNVREGAQISPGTPLMRIADLSHVWIVAELPEALGAAVRAGVPARAQLTALPGRIFPGTIDYVYPRLNTETRTLRARIALDNPDRALRPGMYADVMLGTAPAARPDVLTVPTEAVIRTGTRSVVIVADGAGRFHPAQVVLGSEQGERTVIVSGLEEGQQVVASGQFLIDSEASLRGAYERLDAGDEPPTPVDPAMPMPKGGKP
ncbi:MAG: efflux RND transporter periplasmic adaptor subunit [Nevskia sp.]|nr:efflux RND transporter periplasmic adaptor subunit [Nevskia sp.]